MASWERWEGSEIAKMGGSWFYSRVGDAQWVQDFIFLLLMLIFFNSISY